MEVCDMTHRKQVSFEKDENKDDSKRNAVPPRHAINSLQKDVQRKREQVEKSTLGGY